MDYYKDIMRENGLYVLAISEVRRDDSGEEDVGDGCIFYGEGGAMMVRKEAWGFYFLRKPRKRGANGVRCRLHPILVASLS